MKHHDHNSHADNPVGHSAGFNQNGALPGSLVSAGCRIRFDYTKENIGIKLRLIQKIQKQIVMYLRFFGYSSFIFIQKII